MASRLPGSSGGMQTGGRTGQGGSAVVVGCAAGAILRILPPRALTGSVCCPTGSIPRGGAVEMGVDEVM